MPFVAVSPDGDVARLGLAGFSSKLKKTIKKVGKSKVAAIASGGVTKAAAKLSTSKVGMGVATLGVSYGIDKATKGKGTEVLKQAAGTAKDKPKKEPETSDEAVSATEPTVPDEGAEAEGPGMQKSGGLLSKPDGSPNYLLIGGLGVMGVAVLLLLLKKKRK
jgi:hypothetical protein